MTALKHSAATLALLFASGMAYAQDSTAVQPQPGTATAIECPAPGSVPEADLKPECEPGMSTSAAPKVEGDATATGTAEAPPATTEIPKTEADSMATGTAEVPKQDGTAAAGRHDDGYRKRRVGRQSGDCGARLAVHGPGRLFHRQ